MNFPIDNAIFIQLIKLFVCGNVFVFLKKLLPPEVWNSMGYALSPVLCNIFIENFESELVPRIWNVRCLKYVDDLLFIWLDDMDFNRFFIALNELYSTIMLKKHEWKQMVNYCFQMKLYIRIWVCSRIPHLEKYQVLLIYIYIYIWMHHKV